jgi:zinc/manganese transport system substrate-binding protein
MKCIFALCLLVGISVAAAETRVFVGSLSTVLSDIARNVGGDRVVVTDIVKPGIDPHDFQPNPSDVKTLSKARLILASGLGFESYLSKLRSAVGSGPVFVVAGDAVKPLMVEEGHHDHDHDHAHDAKGRVADPHWWHSIANVKIATRLIRDALSAANPADRAVFEANAKTYMAKLDDLAKWSKAQVARLPKSQRILVTSHDALGYFARDYGFVIHPVEGITPGEQPSSRRVQELIAMIEADGVKAIFAENIENPKVLGEITRETGARLGGTLYADGLGTSAANTYDAMMRHNISTIVGALQ